jgi:hypothetical protein
MEYKEVLAIASQIILLGLTNWQYHIHMLDANTGLASVLPPPYI